MHFEVFPSQMSSCSLFDVSVSEHFQVDDAETLRCFDLRPSVSPHAAEVGVCAESDFTDTAKILPKAILLLYEWKKKHCFQHRLNTVLLCTYIMWMWFVFLKQETELKQRACKKMKMSVVLFEVCVKLKRK